MNIDSFVRFFREKYRLCWKEIYLKFMSMLLKPEQCTVCREWFTVTEIADCRHRLNGEAVAQENLDKLDFHKIDHEGKEIQSLNDFTKNQVMIYLKEFQVIDNLNYTFGEGDQKVTHLDKLVERYKDQIDFIEPQSMNYDIKMSKAFTEYCEQDAPTKISKSQPDLKVASSMDFITKEGEKLETQEQQFDDILYRGPQALTLIVRKLKDSHFMKKLQKQCELYVLENADQFVKSEVVKNKFDYSQNKVTDSGSRKKKGALDPMQAHAAQELVIKRFKRTRADLIYEDDESFMKLLNNLLTKIRETEENKTDKKPLFQKIQAAKTKLSLITRGKSPPGGAGRHRSPIMGGHGPRDNSGVRIGNVAAACDLTAQSGVKIYSDIKQITVKKITTKKSPSTGPTSGGAARKNFLQRNIARSQGGRSGSNKPEKETIPPVLGGTPSVRNTSGPR